MHTSRPALRPGVTAAVDAAGRLRMIKLASSTHLVYDVAPPVLELVALLDGTYTRSDLTKILQSSHPQVGDKDVTQILQTFEQDDLLELPDHGAADLWTPALSDLERRVYRRQLDFLADFATVAVVAGPGDTALRPEAMQRRMRGATVAVLGLGGTGSWVAQSLALCGVGRLRLVDADVVEHSNLARQVLYGTRDIGADKSQVAAASLRDRLGDLCVVEPVRTHISGPDDLSPLVADCDLVINCADEPDINTTSNWVAEACMPLPIPHLVGGGYDGHVGMIGPTIVPFETACWGCFGADHARRWPPEPLTYLIPTRRRHRGAFAPLAAVVTNLQVWDAVRVLTGCGSPVLANRHGELDLTDLSITWTDVPRALDCTLCGTDVNHEQ